MGINPEQQEVIDLLRNELAEIVDRNLQSFDQESRSHQCEVLEEFCLYADNVGNASKIVGLFGLSKFCDCIQVIFKSLLAQDSLTKEQWEVAPNWAQFILGYLQYYDRPEKQSSSVQKLTLFIKLPIWEDIISAADAEEIDILFSQSKLNIESDSNQYPQSVTADMVSLEIGPEVKPELLQGLRVELPDQVDTFDKAIEQYIVSANVDQLRIAQRIAHTLKGSANIVGIKGIANLMHYVEDILEQSERYDLAADLGDLMLECADCLSSMFEYVAGFGPEPNDTFATMQKVLDILNQNSCGFGGDSRVVSATEPFNKAVEHIGENDAVQSSVSSSEHADDRNSVDASSEKELAINDEDFSVVVDEKSLKPNFDDLLEQADFDVPNTDTLALDIESIDNEIENYAPKEQPNDDLDEDIDFEVTEDFEFEETSIESMPPEELLLTELSPEELSSLKIPEEEVVDEPTVVSLKIVPKKESFQQSELDEEALHNTFSLKEESARELLRLTGETQIANTQIFGRVSAVEQELKITALYHDKLRQISAMLDRFAERQTGAAAAARTGFDTDIDPIELERYNELNTFSSELQEVTTDAFEAVSQIASELKDLKSTIITQRQNSFDSQDILLGLRMIPVSLYSSRFNRCVRQAARVTGKPAQLDIIGEDVLIDSRVLNGLLEPIMHLLRNAVDHGLEKTEEQRKKLNKPSVGKITLSFISEGETVTVKCIDDGHGIDYLSVEALAKERNLINAEVDLSDSELNTIILSSGFSTRREATQTSGRGIGLDVVNEEVRKLEGKLEITSKRNAGTCVTIAAPTSILSAHTLIVKLGETALSVLSRGLEQVIYLENEKFVRKDEKLYYRYNDDLMPLFKFDELMPLLSRSVIDEYSVMVVLKNKVGLLCGILFESIVANEMQIIKPLSIYTYRVPGVVGASILENGQVSPVINLTEIPEINFSDSEYQDWHVQLTRRLNEMKNQTPAERPVVLVVDDSLSARRSLAQFVLDLGMEVSTAKDGLEAIQVIDDKTPSLMLVDLEMPRMNGLELTSHVRADKKTCDIPIIMITSRATEKHRNMAEKVGANFYLNKPWTDEELMSLILNQTA